MTFLLFIIFLILSGSISVWLYIYGGYYKVQWHWRIGLLYHALRLASKPTSKNRMVLLKIGLREFFSPWNRNIR